MSSVTGNVGVFIPAQARQQETRNKIMKDKAAKSDVQTSQATRERFQQQIPMTARRSIQEAYLAKAIHNKTASSLQGPMVPRITPQTALPTEYKN